MWLHIILVTLTSAVLILLSLSVSVIGKGMYSESVYLKVSSDLALYLFGKSLSNSWIKGEVTFINSMLYFVSTNCSVNYLSFLAHTYINWLAFWMEFKKWPMSTSVIFTQTKDWGKMSSLSLQLCPGPGMWNHHLVEISAALWRLNSAPVKINSHWIRIWTTAELQEKKKKGFHHEYRSLLLAVLSS